MEKIPSLLTRCQLNDYNKHKHMRLEIRVLFITAKPIFSKLQYTNVVLLFFN